MAADRKFVMQTVNLCFDAKAHRYIVSACHGTTMVFWRSFAERDGYDARAYAELKAKMYGVPFVDETEGEVKP